MLVQIFPFQRVDSQLTHKIKSSVERPDIKMTTWRHQIASLQPKMFALFFFPIDN